MKTPENIKYAKTDEWVRLEGKIAVIGISDYAQDQLSDIVYVEFTKDKGEDIKKDVGKMIPKRVEFPEVIINRITEHPNGLVGIPLFEGKYRFDPLPAQVPDMRVLIDHPIIPVRKLVSKGTEIKDSYRKAEEYATCE